MLKSMNKSNFRLANKIQIVKKKGFIKTTQKTGSLRHVIAMSFLAKTTDFGSAKIRQRKTKLSVFASSTERSNPASLLFTSKHI